jgi:hypothetical protein
MLAAFILSPCGKATSHQRDLEPQLARELRRSSNATLDPLHCCTDTKPMNCPPYHYPSLQCARPVGISVNRPTPITQGSSKATSQLFPGVVPPTCLHSQTIRRPHLQPNRAQHVPYDLCHDAQQGDRGCLHLSPNGHDLPRNTRRLPPTLENAFMKSRLDDVL